MSEPRSTTHHIHEVFTQRWSPRSFTGEAIDEKTLMSFFEAAHWAPSAHNSQPWRFIYALKGSLEWEPLFAPIFPQNQIWAQNASALVLFVAQTQWIPPLMDHEVPLPYHALDVGAAAMCFSLQATMSGWDTHPIAGFDKESAHNLLGIPDLFAPLLLMAVGRRNPDISALPKELQEREKPSSRIALNELVSKGLFQL
ncbi:nitroreductase family protein [Saezia sanguinis]|uniref:nitroreductase family protein n=1 Tax=Saezia sanguinis TaxID=1965230 RepID=UPI00305454A6